MPKKDDEKEINNVQELQLRLLEFASFNDFDGSKVLSQLRDNRHLWKAVLMTRLKDLVSLRDISKNEWNVDSLYILPQPGKELELEVMALRWNARAHHVKWIGRSEAMHLLGTSSVKDVDKAILSIWWD